MRIVLLAALAIVLSLICNQFASPPVVQGQMIARSRVDNGNLARLRHTMAKAARGQAITVGFIGGSITFGQQATTADRQYADRVTRWWVEHFPSSQITMVNAGVPGTGSNYGCLRVGRDLLSHHPDFVVVEFGVNDRDDLAHAQTYEGVVRQLMADLNNPAVLLLFMMHHDGTNAQSLQSDIGRQYQLPMVSFRDAVWPEITAGHMQVTDVLADTVHPNDRGHAIAAGCVTALLQETFDHLSGELASIPPLPSPRFTKLFAQTKLVEAADLKPLIATGWNYDGQTKSWMAEVPGSAVEFEIAGPLIDLLYARVSNNAGTAIVTVDDGPPVFCDSWFDSTWAGYCQVDVIAQNLSPAKHRVRIELSNEKNPSSTGHHFQILELGSAGH